MKQQQIVADLRRRIVSGAVPKSGRLAARTSLCKEYNASSVTVQQALDELVADGFVVSRGSRGTFVSDTPPHLTRYAIVVTETPGGTNYNRFWITIEHEAQQLKKATGLDLQMFHGVEAHTDNEPFQQIVEDVRRHRLAGIIFLHPPHAYLNTPLLDEPGIPRVAFMDPTAEFSKQSVQAVTTDYESLIQRGLDYLLARGRRRVGIISQPYLPGDGLPWIQQQVADRGMFMEPYWMQMCTIGSELMVKHTAQLLTNTNQLVRPDGLIIADDNFVEAACSGLIAGGVRVPDDLEVVTHCNFPSVLPSVLPVKRLGFDGRRVLSECIRALGVQPREGGADSVTYIPAIFEEELTTSRA